MKSALISLLLFLAAPATASSLTDIVQQRCPGETDVRINGVVTPCIFNDYVVVFDISRRWAEAIAKAIELGEKTDRIGAVVLIGSPEDKGYRRARELIYRLPLPVELGSLPPPEYGI